MQNAYSWARTQLARKYREELRGYITEIRGDSRGLAATSKASSKAKTRLVHAHYDEFHKIYRLGLKKGFPVSSSNNE